MKKWSLIFTVLFASFAIIQTAWAISVQKTESEVQSVVENSDDPGRTEAVVQDLKALGVLEVLASPTPTPTAAPSCKSGEYFCVHDGNCKQWGCSSCSNSKCY
jgi:hypothetical protein